MNTVMFSVLLYSLTFVSYRNSNWGKYRNLTTCLKFHNEVYFLSVALNSSHKESFSCWPHGLFKSKFGWSHFIEKMCHLWFSIRPNDPISARASFCDCFTAGGMEREQDGGDVDERVPAFHLHAETFLHYPKWQLNNLSCAPLFPE